MVHPSALRGTTRPAPAPGTPQPARGPALPFLPETIQPELVVGEWFWAQPCPLARCLPLVGAGGPEVTC
eukprot:11160166-Lingulodinium_polyedra.AAC.1